jgi:hypothetical protein
MKFVGLFGKKTSQFFNFIEMVIELLASIVMTRLGSSVLLAEFVDVLPPYQRSIGDIE